ncbi:MAG: ribonuclease HII [Nitrososphaera sp.]|jgi:ribonuclease HII
MLVCGVDDAGRGSVIGPLVIAGISIEKNKIKYLSEIGVRDSKQLTPASRQRMYKKILSIVDGYHVAKISPKIIDQSVATNDLNQLEARYMAKVIAKLKPDLSYVDSCDVIPKRFGMRISEMAQSGKIHSSHHADRKYTVVSAASIIAKVNRDREIEKLRKKHNLGSGYPSDAKTMNFIKSWVQQKSGVPKFVRTSWKPVKLLMRTV